MKTLAGMEFKDISSEEYRIYTFSFFDKVRIEKPQWLHVKKSETGDSHRIIDAEGVSHYIPSGWIALSWKSPEGKEFVF